MGKSKVVYQKEFSIQLAFIGQEGSKGLRGNTFTFTSQIWVEEYSDQGFLLCWPMV